MSKIGKLFTLLFSDHDFPIKELLTELSSDLKFNWDQRERGWLGPLRNYLKKLD